MGLHRAAGLDTANVAIPMKMAEAARQYAARTQQGEEAPFVREALAEAERLQQSAEALAQERAVEAEAKKKVRAEEERLRAQQKAKEKKARAQADKEKEAQQKEAERLQKEEAKKLAEGKGEVFLEAEPEAVSTTSTAQEVYEAKARMLTGSLRRYDHARVEAFANTE